jgi:hypothetical protein
MGMVKTNANKSMVVVVPDWIKLPLHESQSELNFVFREKGLFPLSGQHPNYFASLATG